MARLTLEDGCIVLSPLWPWRELIHMPVLRIPLEAVEMVSRITFGIRFTVPSDPALDGARFKRWWGQRQQLQELIEFLRTRGIPVQTMPRSERVRGFLHDYAIATRPGWIWRDRGWLAFLESAGALAAGAAVLLASGFFSDAPTPFLVWFGFIVFTVVWGWFAGHRHRKKLSRRRDGGQV